jgi:glucose-6-phosphate isomerase
MIKQRFLNCETDNHVYESVLRHASEIAALANNTKYYKAIKAFDVEKVLANIKQASEMLKEFKTLIIVGMGGAVNNPKSVLAALNVADVVYLNTTDSHHLGLLLQGVDLTDAGVLVISNSGQTTETIAIYLYLLEIDASLKQRSVFLTCKGESPLRNISESLNILTLEHDPLVGGRFSGFGEVIALPLAARGKDARSFLIAASNFAINIFAQELNALARSFRVVKADIW